MYFFLAVLCFVFTRCVCQMQPFVVGGDYAKIKSFPHAVFLRANCRFQWICGASLLNQRILLTAAHCLSGCQMNYRSQTIKAFAGHENLDKAQIVRSVKYITIHSNYDEITVANDIGLLVLTRDVPLGNTIKRVIIARRFPPNIRRGVVAGWGIINEVTEEETVLLKSVTQTIRGANVCALIGELEEGMFCAGSTNPAADHPSKGDSGSALITTAFEEIGLVSFKVKPLPALMVYTNITYYYNWIHMHAKKLYCKSRGK